MPDRETIQRYASDLVAFVQSLVILGARGVARFGDVMADFQRETFIAIAPAAVALVNGTKPPVGKFWIERTKGGSKDSDLACVVLWLLLFVRRPILVQTGAADRDQSSELRKAAAELLRLNPWLAERIEIQAWRIVNRITGSVCEIVAADAAGSHGSRPDVLILNELSHVGSEEFASNMVDNAAKVPNGIVIIATNAGFADTWQARWRAIAATSPRWSMHVWNRPAPWLDESDIAEAKQRNPASRFNRLWHGVWSSGSGDAIDGDDLQVAVDPKGGPMFGDEGGFGFLLGLDLGLRRDHSAATVLGYDFLNHRVRLAACESWAPPIGGQIDLVAVQERVLQLCNQFRCGMVFDPWQAALMAQQVARHGVPVFPMPFSGPNLNRMAGSLLSVFRERRIDLYHDEELLKGLGRLSIVERSFGVKLEAPRDKSGHCDKAFSMAIVLPDVADLAATYSPPPADDNVARFMRSLAADCL